MLRGSSHPLREAKPEASGSHRKSGDALAGLKSILWAELTPDQRVEFLKKTNTDYNALINEFTLSANLCVERHRSFVKLYQKWKRILILSTGAVALLNLLATNKSLVAWNYHPFPILAAIAAVALTLFANFDSFYNAAEKAHTFRESREMFLDAVREYGSAWDTYVRPLADTPDACANAAELYRRIVAADRELRARFKEPPERKG